MALKLRRAGERFIPYSTRAVSFERLLGVAPSTAHVWMSDIFNAADWSQAPMLVAASKQFPLLMVGEFGLGGIPTAVGQFSPYRSPGQSERTRGADR